MSEHGLLLTRVVHSAQFAKEIKTHGGLTGSERGFAGILERASDGLHAAKTRFSNLFGRAPSPGLHMHSVLGADAATHHVGVMALHGADPLRQAAAAGLPSLRPPSQHTPHMQHPHAQQQDAVSLPAAAAAAAARGSSESSVLPFAAGADAADEDIGGGGGRVRRRSTTAYKISLTVESEVERELRLQGYGTKHAHAATHDDVISSQHGQQQAQARSAHPQHHDMHHGMDAEGHAPCGTDQGSTQALTKRPCVAGAVSQPLVHFMDEVMSAAPAVHTLTARPLAAKSLPLSPQGHSHDQFDRHSHASGSGSGVSPRSVVQSNLSPHTQGGTATSTAWASAGQLTALTTAQALPGSMPALNSCSSRPGGAGSGRASPGVHGAASHAHAAAMGQSLSIGRRGSMDGPRVQQGQGSSSHSLCSTTLPALRNGSTAAATSRSRHSMDLAMSACSQVPGGSSAGTGLLPALLGPLPASPTRPCQCGPPQQQQGACTATGGGGGSVSAPLVLLPSQHTAAGTAAAEDDVSRPLWPSLPGLSDSVLTTPALHQPSQPQPHPHAHRAAHSPSMQALDVQDGCMGNEVADAVQYSGGYMGWLGDEHHHHHEHEQHQHHQHGDGEGEGSEEQGAMNLSDVLPCLPQPGVQAARGLAAIEGLRAEEARRAARARVRPLHARRMTALEAAVEGHTQPRWHAAYVHDKYGSGPQVDPTRKSELDSASLSKAARGMGQASLAAAVPVLAHVRRMSVSHG